MTIYVRLARLDEHACSYRCDSSGTNARLRYNTVLARLLECRASCIVGLHHPATDAHSHAYVLAPHPELFVNLDHKHIQADKMKLWKKKIQQSERQPGILLPPF